MAKEYVHEGTRSWWDGTVRTLCGLVLTDPQRRWFASSASCPACQAARKAGKR
ncbi:hypothetical protein [Actinophytocola gossypii]|uniref:Zinc-ribbon domain-containing protein n=1 Tax=Actinophytocola gossypii TaxID=2812003 RepID=A0ABT2JJ55_9PSEU|nr:hypothetical protein [Actinophytocola gossypii]MCT2587778.1 hypothetical protein [Actinophytocola gossypii]